jgi:hypothetical protein
LRLVLQPGLHSLLVSASKAPSVKYFQRSRLKTWPFRSITQPNISGGLFCSPSIGVYVFIEQGQNELRNQQCSLMTTAEMVLETFVYLMRLLAREYFTEFGRSGSLKLRNFRLVEEITITNMTLLNLWAASIRFQNS